MPKGYFSQGICLLTDGRVGIANVRLAINESGFHVHREIEASEYWGFNGPGVLIPFRPDVGGVVMVDVVNHPWPDTMGDPKSDTKTFGAWSMGYFGPFAFPGGLDRAIQHTWRWESGREIAPAHRGFIRIRCSYVAGASKNAACLPTDYDPSAEIEFMSRLVIGLGHIPGVLCYFNPNGEVLQDTSNFASIWGAAAKQGKMPLLLWMNVRLFTLDNEFGLMDTVGNSQLDVRDIESIYAKSRYDPSTIDYYMRNVTHYLLDLGRDIQTGELIDGPGENSLTWTIEACDVALVAPPRRVLRLYPKADEVRIRKALVTARSSAG